MVTVGDFSLVYDPSVGEGERWYINDHTFIRDRAGTWHLIGITHAEPAQPFDEKHLAHATASSLHGPWTKQPYALSHAPSAGETHLWAPHVIDHDGSYWMFVCGGGPSPTEYRIQLATSTDCVTWTRHPGNPLVVDGYEARDPMVVRVQDRWVMYYTATSEPSGGNHVVIATESEDLVTWHGRTIVYTDHASGTGGGPTESPFFVARDGRFLLFIGPDWDTITRNFEATGRYSSDGYRSTRVLESDGPFHFDAASQIATVNAHAAEVITDEHGETWVSHCGWGQGGVYLAPISFH